MHVPSLRELPRRTPFFYGWVIVGCVVLAAFARQGAAVATLSVFVNPMIAEFGWSRTALSGAVALGGALAALTAPIIGPMVDRRGGRVVLTCAALVVAGACLALSQITTLLGFYVAFALGRLTFASPFDIGITAALASWFVRRRAQAMAYVTVGSTIGLAVMPMLAYLVIETGGWRAGWIAVALAVLLAGALPNALLMHRRPEDVGLWPDGDRESEPLDAAGGDRRAAAGERQFTRSEAMRTPALWLLMGFSALIFPVQAGISLHQAPHVIQRGLAPAVAASVVSTFSLAAAGGGLGAGLIGRRWPVRYGLAGSAVAVAGAAYLMVGIDSAAEAYASAALFGIGIGGVLTLLPLAWADYFGRANFGAIRGITLPVQVLAQAVGPILAGALYDATGTYRASLLTLGALAAAAAVLGLLALAPRSPPPAARGGRRDG